MVKLVDLLKEINENKQIGNLFKRLKPGRE
jgi:hypothetical protein